MPDPNEEYAALSESPSEPEQASQPEESQAAAPSEIPVNYKPFCMELCMNGGGIERLYQYQMANYNSLLINSQKAQATEPQQAQIQLEIQAPPQIDSRERSQSMKSAQSYQSEGFKSIEKNLENEILNDDISFDSDHSTESLPMNQEISLTISQQVTSSTNLESNWTPEEAGEFAEPIYSLAPSNQVEDCIGSKIINRKRLRVFETITSDPTTAEEEGLRRPGSTTQFMGLRL